MSGVARTLAAALGAEAVSEPDRLAAWAVGGRVPEAVAFPATVEEVRAVLAAAAREGLGVVPLGGATAVGCEPPSGPFVVLATGRMRGIEGYEPADLTVTARAGTLLVDLATELAREGQWLPVDPPLAARTTFGGVVATGTAGSLGTAYGAPRDHVLGLTAVTGDARVLRLGGRVMKNVAGFDLVKLMVGSRGTLGVVVSATVRLFPRPEEDRVLRVDAPGVQDLLPLARAVASAPVVPASAALVAPGAGGPGGQGATLVVRLQGAVPAVDADEARLFDGRGTLVTRVPRSEAGDLLDLVRDRGAAHALVVRASALPGALGEVLAALRGALPGAEIAADVLAGTVRAATGAPDSVDAAGLVRARERVEALRGTLVLERAPAHVLADVSPWGDRGGGAALARALKERLDPLGVLSPGRFVP